MLTANIHNAVAVQVVRTEFFAPNAFHSLRFVVTTASGEQVEISAFSAEPLTLTDTNTAPALIKAQEVAA